MATNTPRPLTPEIRAKGKVPPPPPPPPSTLFRRGKEYEIQRLRECAEAGYELSRWAASINWGGGPNYKPWLRDLQRYIQRVQELYDGPRGGMQVKVEVTDDDH